MATKTPTRQERRAAVQERNPLDDAPLGAPPDIGLGDNLGDADTAAAPARTFSQADVDAAVALAVQSALNTPKYTESEMQAMLARAREEALATQLEKAVVPLSPEQEAAVSHISTSGRAPSVEAKDRVWIILDDNDEIPPGGQFIGVNGVGYQLLPGVEAFVPRAVCEVLDHAVKSIPVLDPMTKRVIGWKNRKRFPYTIVTSKAQQPATEDA